MQSKLKELAATAKAEHEKFEAMKLFRLLEEDEMKEFEQWAIDNFQMNMYISPTWHPVIVNKLESLQQQGEKLIKDLNSATI